MSKPKQSQSKSRPKPKTKRKRYRTGAAAAPVGPSHRELLLRELETRRDARSSLTAFCKYQIKNFEDPPHIHILHSYLEKVARREITRLMVFMPPRHGKTESVSIQFPAWYLGHHPQHQIIGASYSEPLAYNNSRACRDTITSAPYQRLWPCSLDAEGVLNWRIAGKDNKRPNYVAAGAGGAMTGEGADILVIDDPIKNYEEACSMVMRESKWEWYRTVVRTRLQPNAAIILIVTRWHHDDMAGRLLRLSQTDPLASKWTVLLLPSEDPDGSHQRPPGIMPPYESLWPGRYPPSELAAIRADLGSRMYTALYMQQPSDEGGSIIKRDWIRYYKPDPVEIYKQVKDRTQSWDMSFKDTSDSSFVVGGVWGRIGADKFLIDLVRKRMDFAETCHKVVDLSSKWPLAGRKMVEDKANGPAVISHLRHIVSGLIPMPKQISKEAALQAASPDFEAGNVWFPDPERFPWVRELVEELCTFGTAAHTDQCDMTSQAINYYRSKNSNLLRYLKEERAKIEEVHKSGYEFQKSSVDSSNAARTFIDGQRGRATLSTPHYPTIDDVHRRMF